MNLRDWAPVLAGVAFAIFITLGVAHDTRDMVATVDRSRPEPVDGDVYTYWYEVPPPDPSLKCWVMDSRVRIATDSDLFCIPNHELGQPR